MGSFSEYEESVMDDLIVVLGGDRQQNHVSVGRELPKMSTFDLVALLAHFSPNVVHAVTQNNALDGTVQGGALWDQNRVVQADLVDASSGHFIGELADQVSINSGDKSTSVAEYVAGVVRDGDPAWVRGPGGSFATGDSTTDALLTSFANSYEVCSNRDATDGGQGYIAFVRQMLADWQACVDYAALQIATNLGANADLDPGAVEGFHLALGKLAVDLDVLQETPPVQHTVQESWRHAVDKTEAALKDAGRAAGEAAAELGKTVGEVAGSAASGFFSQATLLSLAVAGVAVFVLTR